MNRVGAYEKNTNLPAFVATQSPERADRFHRRFQPPRTSKESNNLHQSPVTAGPTEPRSNQTTLDGFNLQKKVSVNQQHIRQQTTTNDYSRLQTFNQRLFLDRLRYFAASNLKTMEYCISTILEINGAEKKTSGLLPNCRMRNRLPVILRNLQQMPIKRQAQTVLYPMFPKAKIQLFHNMQVFY